MKAVELRIKTDDDLRALLEDLHEKFSAMRFDLAQGKVKNTSLIREIKQDIARIKTVMRERNTIL